VINVDDKVNCCGCEACFNVCPSKCITMENDEEGFLYPKVNNSLCTGCGLCENVCPIINYVQHGENNKQEGYILQHKNDEICKQSTSGGAFTGIATYVINHGGIVFGVEMSDDLIVKHACAEKIEELSKFRNSKYVQSRIGTIYQNVKEELDKDRMVCFSGTPCQIEGLRHYLRKKYSNLVLVDVVCRAVPSPGIWNKYVNYETNNIGGIASVRFRDKTLGYQYSTMELRAKNGKIFRSGIESQPWLRMFFSGMIIRPSCTECKFRNRYRNSDLTIWDCFNSYRFDKNMNERRGTTRVLVHTENGKNIIEGIKNSYIITQQDATILVRDVKEMHTSPKANSRKNDFFRDINNLPFEYVLKEYYPNTIKVKITKRIRIILSYLHLDSIVKRLLKRW